MPWTGRSRDDPFMPTSHHFIPFAGFRSSPISSHSSGSSPTTIRNARSSLFIYLLLHCFLPGGIYYSFNTTNPNVPRFLSRAFPTMKKTKKLLHFPNPAVAPCYAYDLFFVGPTSWVVLFLLWAILWIPG